MAGDDVDQRTPEAAVVSYIVAQWLPLRQVQFNLRRSPHRVMKVTVCRRRLRLLGPGVTAGPGAVLI